MQRFASPIKKQVITPWTVTLNTLKKVVYVTKKVEG